MIPVPLSPLPDDGRDYRLYRHASGMRCLLISDPAAARGTCVMQVDCGSHDEPDSHPGLAHLLEHMLFMGSAGYSAPGSFAALVTRWSGRFNASTAAEITRFFFTASPEGLQPCGLQLADMLAAPLLDPAMIASERRVIDAEFLTRLADDALHEQAAMAQVVNAAHPMSRFTAGNRHSLTGTDEDLAAHVRAFHQAHYRASNMVLVLHASHPAAELLHLAERIADRQAHGLRPERQHPAVIQPRLLPWQLARQSTASEPRCQLIYPLYDAGWLAEGSEGEWLREWITCAAPSGALGWLRGQGLVTDLSVRIEHLAGEQGLLYVDATQHSAWEDHRPMLDAWQQWLNWLDSLDPAEWPLAARRALLDQAFTAGPAGDPVSWLKRLASRLQRLPADCVLEPEAYRMPPDPRSWQQLLSQLHPAALVLIHTSQRTHWHDRAAWTGTGFALAPLVWRAPEESACLTPEEGPDYNLPGAPTTRLAVDPGKPGLRVERFGSQDRFGGEIRTRLGWYWPVAKVSEPQLVWLQACWTLQCESLAQRAKLCGVELAWQRGPGTLAVTLTGRSGSLLCGIVHDLLENLVQPPGPSILSLAGYRLNLWQVLQNEQLPAYRCLDALAMALIPQGRAEIPAMTAEEAGNFWQRLLGQAQMGWLQPVDWRSPVPRPDRLVPAFPLLEQAFSVVTPGPTQLPPGVGVLRVNVRFPDRAQVLYCQGQGGEPANRAGWLLLHSLLAGPFFDSLRTRQGLGYWVVARYHEVGGVPGILWLVQSPSHTHRQITRAIDTFLQEQERLTGELSFDLVQAHAHRLMGALTSTEVDADKQFEDAWSGLSGAATGDAQMVCAALGEMQPEHWHAVRAQLWQRPARLRLISETPSKVAG